MNKFVISRTLNCSCSEVFEAWTNENQLQKWWAPEGFTLAILKLDFSIGGVFHYRMATADGYEMWGRIIFAGFNTPNKLVFINSFSDSGGKIKRAPFSDTWPLEIKNELTIRESGEQCILTLQAEPVNSTEPEKITFSENMESLGHGFNGIFDRLEKHINKS